MKTQLHSPAARAHMLARHVYLWAAVGFAAMPFVVQSAQAAVTEAWVHRYSNVVSNANDQAFKVITDAQGDIIVIGSTDDGVTTADMLTIKYSGTNGSLLWSRRYNGPRNGDDYANAVAVDASGDVIVTGSSVGSFDPFGRPLSDYYTAKYAAADGALRWEKRYNGPANEDDQARAVAVDGSGNVIVTGSSVGHDPFGPASDYYTAKYAAADGALLWEKRYSGRFISHDTPVAVAVDLSGNVIVTGDSFIYFEGSDYYTAKYAGADGALLWEKRHNSPEREFKIARAMALDGAGNVIVTGGSEDLSSGEPDSDYYTVKFAAADGSPLWEKRFDGPNSYDYDQANAVAVDGSGNVVVTGYSDNGGAPNYDIGYYTAKYAAANGALLWEKRHYGPGNGDNRAQAATVDGSGNVVVTGYSDGGSGYYDYYTAKYAAADGELLWEKRYTNGLASAVAMDASGNVVVTGQSFNGDSADSDYYTAKYAAADGGLLWESRYIGPGNGQDYPQPLAVDGNGNVVVTGVSHNSSNDDYYTAKYAAGNGVLLWEQRYNGPANGDDRAQAMAVDGNGNVVVTGYSSNGTNTDYYTIKYAAADGAPLWEKRYDSPANSYDSARAVAVDGGDNVVVTGTSCGEHHTVKYAAADGALLWEKRVHGQTGDDWDQGNAVAVDGSGNVIVTGELYYSYYTAKYAAADGALLWEKRYTNGTALAVAVDGSGNAVVTGYSDGDYYTAKYAGVHGALLWEKRYSGPTGGHDYASSLALGSCGSVAITGTSSGDYATILYREVPQVSIALVPAGVRVRFPIASSCTYELQRSGAVTGSWSTLIMLTAALDGVIEYTDTNPPSGQAFYRTAAAP